MKLSRIEYVVMSLAGFVRKKVQKSQALLIIVPELCLTNFDYDNFEVAADFYNETLSMTKKE